MIIVKHGNIFSSNCQCIVNTVNCVGVMGAGIAYECRLRYPKMFERYSQLCSDKKLDIGSLWLYKENERWILNFPTKIHWKYPSKLEYLEKGLQKFLSTYKEKKITSIAFPLLGAKNGGIPESESIELMRKYLDKCDIPVDIYYYDQNAYDNLFLKFKELWLSIPEQEVAMQANLGINFVRLVKSALENDDVRSLSQMLRIKGIGHLTLEKSFQFINNYKPIKQQSLFGNVPKQK